MRAFNGFVLINFTASDLGLAPPPPLLQEPAEEGGKKAGLITPKGNARFDRPTPLALSAQLPTIARVRPLLICVVCDFAHIAVRPGQAPEEVALVRVLPEKQQRHTSRPIPPLAKSRRKTNQAGEYTRSRTDVFSKP